MTDKELLRDLLIYFNRVMADVDTGESFDKEKLPDYIGHEQGFLIDMVVEQLQGMLDAYGHMKSVLMQMSKDGKPLQIMDNMCCTNIKESLEEFEKYMSTNKQINEYFDEI